MSDYAELIVGDHGTIRVEVAPSTKGWQEAGRLTELGEQLQLEFDTVMETVRAAALGFNDGLDKLEKRVRPDEASLAFGLKIGGEAGVVVKGSGEAAFTVSLTWKKTASKG